MQRAALYARISKDDPDEPRLGVQRQRIDLRSEAQRLGLEVVAELEDNDLSGEGKVRRPDFDRLLELIRVGGLDVVLAVDLDRLIRGWEPFVQLYEACQRAQIRVAWLGGSANFRTGDGLLELEIRASFAREELRKLRKRTRRKHLELAENGKDAGGGRPFGFLADRHTLRPPYSYCRLSDRAEVTVDEPELIREAAKRALGEEPLRTICADWERRGVLPAQGGRWSPSVLRRILVSARISGRRELCTVEGKRSMTGEITATAAWPAIISPADSDRLRAMLRSPERSTEARPRKYLLSGRWLRCGICGKPLHSVIRYRGRWRAYGCISGPGFSGGCGRIGITGEPLERYVVAAVLDAVKEGALTRALRAREVDDGPANELLRVEAQMKELAGDWATQQITRSEWQAARGILEARRQALSHAVEVQRRRLALDGIDLGTPLRDQWPTLPLHRKRTIIGLLVDRIEIAPATRRGPVFDDKRVYIHWHL